MNYQDTLEHLNILDADYYFKLLDCMQQQDLAGGMLLYDDIDRKGFEGDLVINGFAEFTRNLLVCKDEKVAGLLEVVESFRERYISTGQKIPAAWLISALNILNEAEINYKAARNKRLHVELTLIKLTYLQQAVELAGSAEEVTKKKVVDKATAVAFRSLRIIKDTGSSSRGTGTTKTKAESARLVIEDDAEKLITADEEPHDIIEQKAKASKTQASEPAQPKPVQNQEIQAQLQNIRKKIANQQNGNSDSKIIPVEPGKLQESWKSFTQQLKDNKNPAAQSFDMARLQVLSENSFEVIANNNLEQKFIEQERRNLSDYLQQLFNNKTLFFNIIIDENAPPLELGERPLNTREQFQKIAEQYPMVKELKDRLKLDLDY